MKYRKALTILLFITSFIVLSLSGYQCATETIIKGPDSNQGVTGFNGSAPNYPYSVGGSAQQPSNLLREPENYDEDSCRNSRSQLREAFSAPTAKIDLDQSALTDFRLGRTGNFDTDCARIFVKMNEKIFEGRTVYQGTMNIAYVGTCPNGKFGICRATMKTGYSTSDARYNKWNNGRRKLKRSNINRNTEFHAIFEDSYGAYILKIEDIRRKNVSDGFIRYNGAGEIHYKMFKLGTSEDIREVQQRGDCYNGGVYISQAHRTPRKPAERCWFTKLGPFSCRPEGDLLSTDQFTDISLTERDYKCFNLLGRFYGLDIEEAFNLNL